MKEELLELLVCPECDSDFELRANGHANGEIESGELVCGNGHMYPIVDHVPRFVGKEEYAEAFAVEWTTFRTDHLDSFTGLDYLDRQLRGCLDFPIERLQGKLVLDAGAGLGRFSEVVANYGGKVVAVDLTRAIDAAYQNLHERDNVHFVQADIFKLPFRPGTFDFAYSWGVLHHTPDPPAAFKQLPPLVKPGGKLMVFVYASYNKAYRAVTEFYRKFTTRLPQRLLLLLCYIAVPLYYVSKIPVIGPFVTRLLIPVSVRPPKHRWRVGNTFDLYSPKYAFAYDHVEVFNWFERAGMEQIRPVAPESGVSYVAVKPPIDEDAWRR
jgi:SAM-dependent methyltransferase